MDEADDIGISFNHLSIVDSLTAEEYSEIDNNLVNTGLLTTEELIKEILLTESVLQQAQEENSSEGEEASIFVKLGGKHL